MSVAKRSYVAQFDHRIAGIPCQIGVTYFHYQPPWRGSAQTCDSDWDYHGYTELEFEVLDRRGRRAEWLERKMNDDDETEIKLAAMEMMGYDN